MKTKSKRLFGNSCACSSCSPMRESFLRALTHKSFSAGLWVMFAGVKIALARWIISQINALLATLTSQKCFDEEPPQVSCWLQRLRVLRGITEQFEEDPHVEELGNRICCLTVGLKTAEECPCAGESAAHTFDSNNQVIECTRVTFQKQFD